MTDFDIADLCRIIPLSDPKPNGVIAEEEAVFQPLIDAINEIMDRVEHGERVYLGITNGERKGSIGYVKSIDRWYISRRPRIVHYYDTWSTADVHLSMDLT